MTQTNQYGFKQWEAHEGLHREEWNQVIASIDSALAGAVAGVSQSLSTAVDGVNQSVAATASQASQALAAETAARNNAIAGLQGQVTALSTAKAELVVGSYAGDGAETREINLGFSPKAVLLEVSMGGRTNMGAIFGGMALPSLSLGYPGKTVAMQVTPNGFQVGYTTEPDDIYTNRSDYSYYYAAVK